ncbi:MAG: DUF4178 domain-containing protein [Bryobacteraceae bacterium]|nr:DUF4178 domain-containing protein [Bryobacteraceae bacterium]
MNVKSIECPNCGGSVELRGYSHSLSAVCIQCLSVIDTSHPQLTVLKKFGEANRVRPLLPLGSRGKFGGKLYEIIGMQERQIVVDGTSYSWQEYLLFNPYAGFRYLSVYRGHWNFIEPAKGLPEGNPTNGIPSLRYQGQKYRHFQTAEAETTFAMGEFPWRLEVGQRVLTKDYIAPPKLLSEEITADEVTYSVGTYQTGAEIAQAFSLTSPLPPAQGVFANQPAPPMQLGSLWATCFLLLCGLLVLALFLKITARNEVAFDQRFHYSSADKESAKVTDPFELKGRTSNVQIESATDLSNDWLYLDMSLINADTGQAWDFGREVSYYSGRDSDGAWTEGNSTDRVTIPSVPPGKYYLRIDPDMSNEGQHATSYTIKVTRDVPQFWFLLIAFPLLMLPAIWRTIARGSFETQRWAESDYVTSAKSSSDDD